MEVLKKAEAEGGRQCRALTQGFSAGIKHLGDLFGRGEVFLPELIFGAEVMKKCNDPDRKQDGRLQVTTKGVFVIGTVEGDVHDIGKGIVASLVKTNGFEVHDIGRKYPLTYSSKRSRNTMRISSAAARF